MPSFADYKRMTLRGGTTTGQHRTYESKGIIEATWYDDPSATIGYFYDYYRDDEPDKCVELHPEKSKTKIPVDIKYLLETYRSLDKDEVNINIMFKPSYHCNIPYYKEFFIDKVSATFPVGLYVDLKNSDDIWERWLVVSTGNVNNRDFPNYSILPCSYRFQWVKDGKKYQIWGVERSQSSYNAGVWREYRVEYTEDQTKFILPYNEISKEIFYNLRMIVSVDMPEPVTWRITKTNGLLHKGTIMYTLYQSDFNPHTDYIERDENGNLLGMWADYYSQSNLPAEEPIDPEIIPLEQGEDYSELTYSGSKPQIKINGSYKTITVTYYNSGELLADQTPGDWSYWIDDTDATDLVKILETDDPNQIKVKFLGDETYLDKALTIRNSRDSIVSELKLQIISL